MDNEILKELSKELNWKEKMIVRIFSKTFYKVYHICRIHIVNKIIKTY